MEGLFLRVATLSLTCSAVILPLLFLGRILRHRYAARTLSFVWLLLALRLLIPVHFALPVPPMGVEVPAHTVHIPAYRSAQGDPGAPAGAGAHPQAPKYDAPRSRSVSTTALCAALWGIGAAGVLLWQCVSYLISRRRLLRRAQAVELALPPGVKAVRSPEAQTPMMLGAVRPVLVLPDAPLDDVTLAVIVRHELCHLRRRDVAYKGLMLLVSAMHWPNPLVWLMAREAGRNLELCCDDEVLKNADRAERRRYGEILLAATADGCAPVFSTRFGSPKRRMKERLGNLFAEKKTSVALIALLLAAVVLAGSAVVLQKEESDTLYRSARDGFTLQLPESWQGQYTAQENTAVNENTGKVQRYVVFLQNQFEGGSPGICRLTIDDASVISTDLAADRIYLGEGGGMVFHLMFYPVSQGHNEAYDTMRADAEKPTEADFHYVGGEAEPEPEPTPAVPTVGTGAIFSDLGVELGWIPENWAGNYAVERGEGSIAFKMNDHKMETLFALQYMTTEDWAQFQAEGKQVYTPIVVLGEQKGMTYFLGIPVAGEAERQEYREMKQSLMAIADQFVFLDGGIRESTVVLPEFDAGTGWMWPLEGCYTISRTYGPRMHPVTGTVADHAGTDVVAPEDSPVKTARGGVVMESGWNEEWGNFIQIDHGDGYATRYCQLASYSGEVGQIVAQGQAIGTVGSTGSATGAHLHLELLQDGGRTDVLSKYPELPFTYR